MVQIDVCRKRDSLSPYFFAPHLPRLQAPSSSLRLNDECDFLCTNIMLPYYEHTFT